MKARRVKAPRVPAAKGPSRKVRVPKVVARKGVARPLDSQQVVSPEGDSKRVAARSVASRKVGPGKVASAEPIQEIGRARRPSRKVRARTPGSRRRRSGEARAPGIGIVAPSTGTLVPGADRLARDLRKLAVEAARIHGGPVLIDVEVVSDREIRRLNRTHLGHDFATDVVSFPLSAPGAPYLVGALAVSRDTAQRESTRRGHAPYHELMLYVVHGTLHLLGHDDHAPRAKARMRRAERELLACLGLPSVYERPARRSRKEVP